MEIASRAAYAKVVVQACSLFVALAEEGWTEGEVAKATAQRYLGEVLASDRDIDTLLLGCTHFPVLRRTLEDVIGEKIKVVDSAETTAAFLAADLQARALAASRSHLGSVRMLATDSAERFARVGSLFLSEPFSADRVELVDLVTMPLS